MDIPTLGNNYILSLLSFITFITFNLLFITMKRIFVFAGFVALLCNLSCNQKKETKEEAKEDKEEDKEEAKEDKEEAKEEEEVVKLEHVLNNKIIVFSDFEKS